MATHASFEIRELKKYQEFSEVVRLQREIWGFDDVELLPLRLFIVAEKIGGQVLGAFDASKMIAFCLSIPGVKPGGKSYLHSHMLGVLPQYRNSGLGRQMKWKQREDALAKGHDLIEWTFDPLEIKNAFFNIERLGAIATRFTHNQYGTTSSHLHGGLPTDRLTVEWWIQSPRVNAIRQGEPSRERTIEATISVPMEIGDLRQNNPEQAKQIQVAIAQQFQRLFAAGLAVTGYERDQKQGTYLLSQWK